VGEKKKRKEEEKRRREKKKRKEEEKRRRKEKWDRLRSRPRRENSVLMQSLNWENMNTFTTT
jgi:hypothetical protein